MAIQEEQQKPKHADSSKEQIIMQTARGLYIDLYNISANELFIEDIAHSLGNQCRYGGHTHEFYSVAEHSVLASKIGEFFCEQFPNEMAQLLGIDDVGGLDGIRNEYLLGLLMHDASEAYLSDVITPIKRKLGDYLLIEERIQKKIEGLLGLHFSRPEESAAIKMVDIFMLIIESLHLMIDPQPMIDTEFPKLPQFVQEWFREDFDIDAHGWMVPMPLLPKPAKQAFLDHFDIRVEAMEAA